MKVAFVTTHPIQYQVPLTRHLYQTGVDIEAIYAHVDNVKGSYDSEFAQTISWDIPLLDGYPYHVLPGNVNFFQLTKAVAKVISEINADAVWIHGWGFRVCQAAWLAALVSGKPILLRADTHLGCAPATWSEQASVSTINSKFKYKLKRLVHKSIYSACFKTIRHFLSIGSANHRFYRAYGVPEKRITFVPHSVDNNFFRQRCIEAEAHRSDLKTQLGIAPKQPIILFAGKLIKKKAGELLIKAFALLQARMPASDPALVMVGDGEEREKLESLAANKTRPNSVKFTGFVNQSKLPAYFDLCDIFVLPSFFEPWGLIVNEVMNAGKAVIVSDAAGCAEDLVIDGVNGYIFRSGSMEDLCDKLQLLLSDSERRVNAGAQSLELIQDWGIEASAVRLTKLFKTIP